MMENYLEIKGRYGLALLVLIEMKRECKSIYELTNCYGLHIEMESLSHRSNMPPIPNVQIRTEELQQRLQIYKMWRRAIDHLREKPKITLPRVQFTLRDAQRIQTTQPTTKKIEIRNGRDKAFANISPLVSPEMELEINSVEEKNSEVLEPYQAA